MDSVCLFSSLLNDLRLLYGTFNDLFVYMANKSSIYLNKNISYQAKVWNLVLVLPALSGFFNLAQTFRCWHHFKKHDLVFIFKTACQQFTVTSSIYFNKVHMEQDQNEQTIEVGRLMQWQKFFLTVGAKLLD